MKYIFPILYFVFGVIASAFLFFYLEDLHKQAVRQDLVNDSQSASTAIQNSFRDNTLLLDAAEAFYQATDRISEKQFSTFVGPLLATHQNVQAFSWVPRILEKNREIYLKRTRERSWPDFEIKERNEANELVPAKIREQYFPVTFMQPVEGNEAALGFDIGSNAKRRTALDLASKTNKKTATAPLDLVQEKGTSKGILIIKATYRKGLPADTAQEREDNLFGFGSLVLSIDDLMADTRAEQLLELGLHIQDITNSENPEYLYGSAAGNNTLSHKTTIEIATRTWEITSSRPKEKTSAYWFPYFILAFGVLFFGLTTYIFYQLIRRREFVRLLVERRTKQLNQLVDKLADSNEELTRFAFVCSHDLQEPLRMIRSFSERLEIHMGDTLKKDEKAQKYFKFITDGASHAQALISDILAYSAVDTDTKTYEQVDSQKLVELITGNLSQNLENSGSTITAENLPIISGNKTQLFQLFQNLITNGLKYRDKSRIPHVHITAQDVGHHWKFSVTDNGIGMETRHLSKIFDVFQRLHKRSLYSGTGIGLSICKKVTERHGGNIWAESDIGHGSTFHFTIEKRPNLGGTT